MTKNISPILFHPFQFLSQYKDQWDRYFDAFKETHVTDTYDACSATQRVSSYKWMHFYQLPTTDDSSSFCIQFSLSLSQPTTTSTTHYSTAQQLHSCIQLKGKKRKHIRIVQILSMQFSIQFISSFWKLFQPPAAGSPPPLPDFSSRRLSSNRPVAEKSSSSLSNNRNRRLCFWSV